MGIRKSKVIENYVKRHRLVFDLTPSVIWECYLIDKGKKLLSDIDAEDKQFVKDWLSAINNYRKSILDVNKTFCSSIGKGFTRKSVILVYEKETDERLYLNLIFNILDKDKTKINKCLDKILQRDKSYNDKDFLLNWKVNKTFFTKLLELFK